MKELVAVEQINSKYNDIIRVEWNIGKRCNFDCSYCPSALHDNDSPHQSYADMCNVIDSIMQVGKVARVSFTGGEPFVNPHFIDVLKYAHEAGINELSTITNGSLPPALYKQAIPYLDNLIYSMHFESSIVSKVQDTILEVAEEVRRLGKHQHVHLMMLPGHFDQAREALELFGTHDIHVSIRRIRPLFNADGSFRKPGDSGMDGLYKSNVNLKPGHTDDNYYSTDELAYLKNVMSSGSTFNNCTAYYMDENGIEAVDTNVNRITIDEAHYFKGWTCYAGIQSLGIDSNGTIYRASCRDGGPIGDMSGFTMPTEPVICSTTRCVCAAEINITKFSEKFDGKFK